MDKIEKKRQRSIGTIILTILTTIMFVLVLEMLGSFWLIGGYGKNSANAAHGKILSVQKSTSEETKKSVQLQEPMSRKQSETSGAVQQPVQSQSLISSSAIPQSTTAQSATQNKAATPTSSTKQIAVIYQNDSTSEQVASERQQLEAQGYQVEVIPKQ